MGLFSRLLGRKPTQARSDPFFGPLRYRRDHWVGSAPDGKGESIEVMLVGPVDMVQLDQQRDRYEALLQRLPDIVNDARVLIEEYVLGRFAAEPSSRFFQESYLIHAMLPNPDDPDGRWDIGVAGPWPGLRERGDDDDPEDNIAELTLQMQDWRPVSVELA